MRRGDAADTGPGSAFLAVRMPVDLSATMPDPYRGQALDDRRPPYATGPGARGFGLRSGSLAGSLAPRESRPLSCRTRALRRIGACLPIFLDSPFAVVRLA